MTHRFARAAAAALLSTLAACGGSSGGTDLQTPTAITATSSPTSTVGAGTSAGVFAVKVTSANGAPVSAVAVSFSVSNGGSATPATATTDANGAAQSTIAAGTTAGAMTVTASVNTTVTTSAVVTVTATPPGCTTLALGVPTVYQGVSSACLTGSAAGTEFTVVAYNSDTTGTQTTSISATGVTTPPSSTQLMPASAYRSLVGSATPTLEPDEAFHLRHLRQSAQMTPLFPAAHAWQAARRGLRANSTLIPSDAASHSAIGANPTVGSVVTLNVNGNDGCSNAINHPVRIMSIGTKSIVMADTLNPSGGFVQADYDQFAANFDTLVYQLDVSNFGAPTDIDGNGRVAIIFTRAVNELTGPSSTSYVGGFFYDRDLFPKASQSMFACPTSNEGEMFYMLAPDPTGVAYQGTDGTAKSSNIRTTDLVRSLTTSTIAHEFQHLINAARKIYVNTGAQEEEVTWLNEGLSHVAEELLYFRQSAMQPRTNLNDAAIRGNAGAVRYQFWKDDDSQNFARFGNWLRAPGSSSPRGVNDSDDDLAARGAAWSFLRYAADRFYTADGDVWFKLVNSTTTGLSTLKLTFGNDPVGLMRDWATANYVDDLTPAITADPRYVNASWDFRDVYTHTFTAGVYPLAVTGLSQGISTPVSVARNSASYYRLAIPAGGQAQLALTATGTSPNAKFQFVVVRTK